MFEFKFKQVMGVGLCCGFTLYIISTIAMASPVKPGIQSDDYQFSSKLLQYLSYESSKEMHKESFGSIEGNVLQSEMQASELGSIPASEHPNGEFRILVILVRLASDSLGAQIRYGPEEG